MAKERKGKKLRRQSKAKTYYASGPMRVATNRKKRMRKHIRSHPNDKEARRIFGFEKNFGATKDFGLNSMGRKRAIRSGVALA